MRQNDITLNKVTQDKNFTFSKHTTYGLGGKVKVAYFPKNEEEAVAVFSHLSEIKENFIVLGNGSNVLASDNYYDGSVICTKYLQGIEEKNGSLKIMSGTTVSALLSYCLNRGLSGLEYLAGIPASIGGLALMNGGINNKRIEENILSVRLFDGKLYVLSNKNCNFGNKYSTMRDIKCLILSICAKVENTSSCEVKEKIDYYLNLRGAQPKGKSCGCIFKNPEGFSAGRLIDEAGLKGLKIGRAEVSREHANFIINNGTRARDVYALISLVKSKVYENTHIDLEEEVVYIGEFNDFNR